MRYRVEVTDEYGTWADASFETNEEAEKFCQTLWGAGWFGIHDFRILPNDDKKEQVPK